MTNKVNYYLLVYCRTSIHPIFGESYSTVLEEFISEKEAKTRENVLKTESGQITYGDTKWKYNDFVRHCCVKE